MIELISLPYFWTYIFASFFSFALNRMVRNSLVPDNPIVQLSMFFGWSTKLALKIFLVIGLWCMPSWWYPIVFFVCDFITPLIPLPDKTASQIGFFAAPILTIASYVLLFTF